MGKSPPGRLLLQGVAVPRLDPIAQQAQSAIIQSGKLIVQASDRRFPTARVLIP